MNIPRGMVEASEGKIVQAPAPDWGDHVLNGRRERTVGMQCSREVYDYIEKIRRADAK